MNHELFVQNVKRLCKNKGISATEACRESGAGRSLIDNVKRGRTPSIDRIKLLADYLGVTTSDLLGDEIVLFATHEFPPVESMDDLLSDVTRSGTFLSLGIQSHCEKSGLDFSAPLYVSVSAKVFSLWNATEKRQPFHPPNPQAPADLTAEEMDMVEAYRAADERAKQVVDLTLEPWKKNDFSGEAM